MSGGNRTNMLYDQFGEVVNREENYKEIAEVVKTTGSAFIGWTDELGSHFDILFTYSTLGYGNHQFGIKSDSDVFVSIMRVGAFAFERGQSETHPSYYAEKLGVGCGPTTTKLAAFINGVRKHL